MSDKKRNKRIFIGGTGRSGTTILYRLMGSHPDVYAFAPEMRFIIDGSGLLPLIDSLSTSYTSERSREQIHRFIRLMKYDLMTPKKSPYKAYNFRKYFGQEYEGIIDRFIKKISTYQYSGQVLQNNYEELYYWTGEYSKWRKNKTFDKEYADPKTYVGKYFKDRTELESIARDFVEELFCLPMNQENKQTWCEKSPGNLFNMNALHRLFPEALFIHVKRDPRGVCQSYMKQDWAPSEMQGSAALMNQLYARWSVLRAEMPDGINYMEVKLEDLVSDTDKVLAEIAEKAGISDAFPGAGQLSKGKANYWQDELSSSEIEMMNELLGEMIEGMGYTISI